MRTLVWIALTWFGCILFTAIGSRLHIGHVLPEIAIVVTVFLALRCGLVQIVVVSLALGYLTGRAALSPLGLHEIALSVCAIGVYLAVGSLVGSGALFFGFVCCMTNLFYHVLLFVMLYWQRGYAGFNSILSATLIPAGVATALMAVLLWPLLTWIDRYLTDDKREDLTWRH